MRISSLQAFTIASLVMAAGFVIWAISFSQAGLHPHPEASGNRPASPDLSEGGSIAELDGATPGFNEARARPLFEANRRPFALPFTASPPAVVAPVAEAVPDISQLSLKGLYRKDDAFQALIVSPEHPDGQWMSAGSTVAGWTIENIESGSAELAFGKTRVRLQLYVDNSLK